METVAPGAAKMTALDFIASARLLAGASGPGRPLEANLRRAISTAYYALFHCLAQCCADMVVGGPGAARDQDAWRQVYRALQHGAARNRCREREAMAKFPPEIRDFAYHFVRFQVMRNSADYDPDAEIMRRSQVIESIDIAERTIIRFPNASIQSRRRSPFTS